MGNSYEGKVALVTGASRGIGEAIAKGFAAEGANVILASRKIEGLQPVVDAITADGGQARAVATHIGQAESIDALVEDIKSNEGRLDVLVNNAATNPVFGPSMFTDEAAFDKIMGVNVKGPFLLSKGLLPLFQEQESGAIVNIASIAGVIPMPGLGIYSVSKSALIGLTKVLASEWAPFGVRVNAVLPGLIKTRFSQALWDSEEILKQTLELQKIKRLGEPEDVVGAVLFLASEEAKFITGQALPVDGGTLP